jgi:acetyl esterase/lipase
MLRMLSFGDSAAGYARAMTTTWTRAQWLLRAGPADYMLAMSVASASLPVIGKHLEPLGAATAMGIWGYRHMPDFLGATARSWFEPGNAELRRQERDATNAVTEAALRGIVAAKDLAIEWPAPESAPPLWKFRQHRRSVYKTSVRYGNLPSQLLDVWRPKDLPAEPAPVLIFVPGGAWVHGSRLLQGYALMSHLAAMGWVCLSIDYRVAPHHRWPAHITDVKTAIAWARANVDKFGGDRNFVAVAGCSAGGHLAALAGLTANDPEMQCELPDGSDTSVDAVVGIYGRYDWEDRSTPERERFVDFLERVVVKKRLSRHPEVFRNASPIARVRPDAPPFLVVHGAADTVIPVAQARAFVEQLRGTSRSTVGYLELPGAQHGFDMTDGARTRCVSTVIGLFLNEIHRSYLLSAAKEVI